MARSPTQNYIHISIDAKICMLSAAFCYIHTIGKNNFGVFAKVDEPQMYSAFIIFLIGE